MDDLKKTFWSWFPLGASVTLLSFMVLGASYQILRASANDPQVQFVKDASASLKSTGRLPGYININERFDIESSLAPFLIVYDPSGKPLFGNGFLNGSLPVPPKGVFGHALLNGENRLTWQPGPSVRIAMVVQKYENGFVLAGRSLQEVEKRILTLGSSVFIGWLFIVTLTFLIRLISFEERK